VRSRFVREIFDRYRIYAVTFVGGGVMLTLEHVTEVPSTSCTNYFNPPHPERQVLVYLNRSFVALVEGGPTTTTVKFRLIRIERRFTGLATEITL